MQKIIKYFKIKNELLTPAFSQEVHRFFPHAAVSLALPIMLLQNKFNKKH